MALDSTQSKYSEQNILNQAYDSATGGLAVTTYGFNGVQGQSEAPSAMAMKVTVVDSYTYIGIAAPGTAQNVAKWQCKKIDESAAGTTVITWADGNANFDNTSTDLTSLSYS